jgi:hypothetical protein
VFDYDRDKEDRGLAIAMMNPTYTRKCPSSDEGPVTHRNPSIEKHEVFFQNLKDREIENLVVVSFARGEHGKDMRREGNGSIP